MDIQTLKGFRDFLPNEARKRQYVLDTLKKVFESYGFEPLETPVLEYEEILMGKYGEEGDKLMYKFTDNGGRKVAMRYDQTVPLARVVAQYANELSLPFKRYQIQNVYRAENTQKGRYREFLQVDVDTVGSPSLLADAEIISLALKSFESLGFKNFKVLINDRRIFQELIKNKLIDESSLVLVLRALDKLEKIGEEGVLEELGKLGIDKNQRKLILDTIQNLLPSEDFTDLFKFLKQQGIKEEMYEFTPSLARGLDYYTSTVFEIVSDNYPAGSLGGGGRYDELIGVFAGKPIPAVGFSFGFDRIIEAMEELNLFPENLEGTKVLVTNTSDRSIQIADEFRDKKINTELYIDDKDLDKQLKYADKKGIPYVLIVEDQTLILKNMITGEKTELSLDNLPNELL